MARTGSRSFETIAALCAADVTLAGPGGPERIEGARVTASFFQALRVVPALGHLFPAEVDQPGGEPVAVLGDGLWRRLGADPKLVGRSIAPRIRPRSRRWRGCWPWRRCWPATCPPAAPRAWTPRPSCARS